MKPLGVISQFKPFTLGVTLGIAYLVGIVNASQAQEFDETPYRFPSTDSSCPWSQSEACDLSHLITVKVINSRSWGSGVLLSRQGNTYLVLTNAHVVPSEHSNTLQVETFDQQQYSARRLTIDSQDRDIALLEFNSNVNYTIAKLPNYSRFGSRNNGIGQQVIASGFPTDLRPTSPSGLHITEGLISLYSDIPFNHGYQVGYTNAIENGMSGGALINQQGELLAINGMHAYPLWGNPYVYPDGTQASSTLAEMYEQYSWGISIHAVLESVLLPDEWQEHLSVNNFSGQQQAEDLIQPRSTDLSPTFPNPAIRSTPDSEPNLNRLKEPTLIQLE